MFTRKWKTAAASAATAAAVFAGGLAMSDGVLPAAAQTAAPTLPETGGVRAANQLSDAFRRVIKAVQPAVVAIRIEKDQTVGNGPQASDGLRQMEDFGPMFRGLPKEFRDQLEQQFRRAPRQNFNPDVPRQGVGSGVIISADGRVLTNNHVIEDADRVYVTLDDGRELQAESWRTDPASDVAVVYLGGGEDYPFVAMGDSEGVELGDWVLAFGNPFNIGTTVTQGIVSARHRSARLNAREDYLQTDAAVNPGNSGGPLVNLRGEVVGINTAISSRSGGYDGVSFAIPSNMVKWVADQLMDEGRVTRSYLGVEMQDLTRDMQKYYGVGPKDGVVVNDVRPDTPAAKAGLESGDVIQELNGTAISGGMQLAGVVERLTPGQSYDMRILRGGEEKTISVTFEAMPEDFYESVRASQDVEEPADGSEEAKVSRLGLEVASLTDELAEKYGLADTRGVLVTDVERGTPASKARLRIGDVIVKVGGRKTLTLDAFRQAVADTADEEQVMLVVRRDGRQSLVLLNR